MNQHPPIRDPQIAAKFALPKIFRVSKGVTTIHRITSTSRGITAFCPWALLLFAAAAILPGCHRSAPLKPYVAYVLNRQSATLAAVNLAEFRVTAVLPIAPEPEHVLARPGARELYITSARGKITVAAYPHLQSVATIDVGRSASQSAFAPDGRSAYVLDPAAHELISLECDGPPGSPPEEAVPKVTFRLRIAGTLSGLALSPDGKTAVVASQNPDQIAFVSTERHEVLGTVPVGRAPGPMVVLPDSSKAFVADAAEDKISVLGIANRMLLSHLETGMRPSALLLKPDGGEIFALGAASSTVVIIDAFHDDVEQTLPVGHTAVDGVFRKDMSVLYIANAGDGSVLAMDPQTRQVLASNHVGMEPVALALTPDERLLVAADRAASSLAVLQADPASWSDARSALLTTIPVGAAPVDVVVPDLH